MASSWVSVKGWPGRAPAKPCVSCGASPTTWVTSSFSLSRSKAAVEKAVKKIVSLPVYRNHWKLVNRACGSFWTAAKAKSSASVLPLAKLEDEKLFMVGPVPLPSDIVRHER